MFTKKILDVFLKFVRILEKHREFFSTFTFYLAKHKDKIISLIYKYI